MAFITYFGFISLYLQHKNYKNALVNFKKNTFSNNDIINTRPTIKNLDKNKYDLRREFYGYR